MYNFWFVTFTWFFKAIVIKIIIQKENYHITSEKIHHLQLRNASPGVQGSTFSMLGYNGIPNAGVEMFSQVIWDPVLIVILHVLETKIRCVEVEWD